MIKRVFSLTLVIILLTLAFQFAVNLFKVEHKIEYSLRVDEKDFKIIETFKKKGEYDKYLFNVKVDEYNFIIEKDNDFNKQKQIVTDIKTYKEKDIFCISLVFSSNKIETAPVCIRENKLYSYLALSNEYNFNEFLNEIPNYKQQLMNNNSSTRKVEDLFVYDNNQYKDEIFLIYNYENIIRITNEYDDLLIFGSSDKYKNNLGRLVDKYYLIPQNTITPEYSTFYAFDVTTQVKKKIKLTEKMSKQLYVNGIYDNKLYLFDKSNLIQYEIDPYEEKTNITGKKDIPAIVYKNGKKEEVSVYDLNNNEITFTEDMTGYETVDFDKIYVLGDYAIYSKGNNIYKVYKDFVDNPILMSKNDKLIDMKVVSNRIYYINNDTLYRYDEKGVIPLIRREEFKYNNLNIFDIYIKE